MVTTKKLSRSRAPIGWFVSAALASLLGSNFCYAEEEESSSPDDGRRPLVRTLFPTPFGGEGLGLKARLRRRLNLPGDRVQWVRFPVQNEEANAQWGDFLTDIARHLPSQYGKKYYSDDRITHAHETTHGINSHLSNHPDEIAPGTRRHGSVYGFYVGKDKEVIRLSFRPTSEAHTTNSIALTSKNISKITLFICSKNRLPTRTALMRAWS